MHEILQSMTCLRNDGQSGNIEISTDTSLFIWKLGLNFEGGVLWVGVGHE